VVVISEFGRTFRENGNRGADHGYGTACWVLGAGCWVLGAGYWVLGSGICSNQIAGAQIKIEQKTLF
jgi:Protein of unknown function (DUF1501)